MTKVTKEDYIDPKYKKLMKSKSGKKMIALFRILTDGFVNRKKLEAKTGFSTSQVRKLLLKAIKLGYIEEYSLTDRIRRWRRKRKLGEPPVRDTGRRPRFYALTSDGMWLMRLDPEVRDRWEEIERKHEKAVTFTVFDSYANLLYATRNHPSLRRFTKPYFFMQEEMHLIQLNPFIYGGPPEAEEESVYTELVKTIKENVRPEHIISYYIALKDAVSEIRKILDRHRLLMEKMQALPEVKRISQ